MLVLFVCHANLNRSPRAAEVFRKLADQKGFDVEIQSAGTDAYFAGKKPQFLKIFGVEHVTQLTNELLEKANVTVALDNETKEEIEKKYQIKPERMISLEIPDAYSIRRGNFDELYEILNKKLEPLAKEISLSQRKRPSRETL